MEAGRRSCGEAAARAAVRSALAEAERHGIQVSAPELRAKLAGVDGLASGVTPLSDIELTAMLCAYLNNHDREDRP